MTIHIKDTPAFHDPKDYLRLNKLLNEVGYSDKNIHEVLGLDDLTLVKEKDMNRLLEKTNGGNRLDTLIRLYLMEVPCEPDLVERAVAPMRVETWEQAGLIKRDKTGVRAQVKLLPFQNLLLAHDLPRRLASDQNADFVMGIGKSTLTLANLTVRKPIGAALDLGTGCGILAFLAASHSERVSAVDYNPRAITFARFNAALNGFSHVACKTGNLFEPVLQETFDLIISNPPFVISPENKYIYRDGGMPADQLCRKIIDLVPKFLNEGGYCHILSNWTETKDVKWQQAIKDWFNNTGCDVWILRSETKDAMTYASDWIRHTEKARPELFATQLQKWLSYYDQYGIEAISSGIITMRKKSSGPNWIWVDEAPDKMLGPCGAAIEQGFRLKDFLETTNKDETLLKTTFRFSPDLRLERHSRPTQNGWADDTIILRLARGLTYSGNIDTFIADLIIQCNGQRPLGVLLGKMATAMKLPTNDISPHLCRIVRGMVERGFLIP